MEKIIVSLFLCLFAGTFESHGSDVQSEQKSVDTAFERAFVRRMNSELVELKDGKIILYTEQSEAIPLLKIAAGIGALVYGSIQCKFFIEAYKKSSWNMLLSGAQSGLSVAAGIYILKDVATSSRKDIPLLTFDHEGIIPFDQQKILWNSLQDVTVDELLKYRKNSKSEVARIIKFFDKFGVVLKISDATGFLPVSIDGLLALINHYLKENGILLESNILIPKTKRVLCKQLEKEPEGFFSTVIKGALVDSVKDAIIGPNPLLSQTTSHYDPAFGYRG